MVVVPSHNLEVVDDYATVYVGRYKTAVSHNTNGTKSLTTIHINTSGLGAVDM